MRQLFSKLLPYVGGGVLGYLVFFPPAAFLPYGAWRPLLLAAFLVIGLVVFTALQFPLTLPRDPHVEPALSQEVPSDIASLVASLTALGFEPLGPPLRIEMRPAAFLWPLVSRQLNCFGNVFCTTTIPRKTGFEFISVVEDDRGWLTSLAAPHGFVLPAAPGSFRQALPGAKPDALLQYHLAAHRFLESQGIRFTHEPEGTPSERVRRSLMLQRKVVMQRPLSSAVVAIWRTLTKRTPFHAPIAKQATTLAAVEYVKGVFPSIQ